MPRTHSIRASLLRNLIAMVLILGIAILLTTVLGARRAVRALSESVVSQAQETVEVELERFFGSVVSQLQVTRQQAEEGLFELTSEDRVTTIDPDARHGLLRQRRNDILVPVIEVHPHISSLMVADGRGREHMILRTDDGWRTRTTRADEWGGEVRWLEWSIDDPERRERRERIDYDPRRRPWFRDAVAAPVAEGSSIQWTEPYIFFTTRDPGITASTTYDLGDGIDRVLGFDVLLNDITEFTRNLRIGRRGGLAVLTDDGRIIGLPPDPRFDDPGARTDAYLKHPAELGLQLVSDAEVAFDAATAADAPVTVRFRSGGEAWWGRVSPFPLAPERQLWISVVVPESDLTGDLQRMRLVMLGIVFAVLAAAVLRAVFLARRFSAPVEALVAQSDRITGGDFEPGPPIESRVTEVRRLAAAQDRMREGLKSLIKLEKLERDLDLARDIQRGLLPKTLPELPGFEIAGWNQAADQTGGDYFDWLTLPDGRVVVVLADVTGHGIGPALIAAVYRAYIRATAGFGGRELAETMAHVNDLLYADTPAERFITTVVAIVDPTRHHLTMVSAGHGPLLYYRAATGEVISWDADTPPMAIIEGMEFPAPREVEMEPGDALVLTTDGFFEWANADGELFGTTRLEAFVRIHHDVAPEQFIQRLYDAVITFSGGTSQDDDLTAVVLRRT